MLWKKFSIGVFALLAAVSLLAAGRALADVADPIRSDAGSAQEALKPGAEHEVFKLLAGEWDAKMTETGPDNQKATHSGAQTATLCSGGLFLVTDYKGTLAGSDFHGHGINGWNPMKKKYEMVWVDPMTPGITVMEGDYDAATKTMTFFMNIPGPDGKPVKCRQTTVITDKDKNTFRLEMPMGEGKWMEMLRIDYTRKSAK